MPPTFFDGYRIPTRGLFLGVCLAGITRCAGQFDRARAPRSRRDRYRLLDLLPAPGARRYDGVFEDARYSMSRKPLQSSERMKSFMSHWGGGLLMCGPISSTVEMSCACNLAAQIVCLPLDVGGASASGNFAKGLKVREHDLAGDR